MLRHSMIFIKDIFKTNFHKLILPFLILVLISISVVYGNKLYKEYKYSKKERIFNSILDDSAKIPMEYWDKEYENMPIKDSYKVVIITHYGGEHVYSEYFKYAAEKIGWQVKIYYKQTLGHEEEILNFDPDFMIMTQLSNPDYDTRIVAHRSKKYLLNLSSLHRARNGEGKLLTFDPYVANIEKLQELLQMSHAVLVTPREVGIYKKMFENLNREFNGIGLFPCSPVVEDEKFIQQYNSIVWSAVGWDKFRSSDKYREFISKLSKNVSMKVYGLLRDRVFHDLAPGTYGGYIKPGIENIKAARENGIYLITHSNLHFYGKEPSMRPFEAIASRAVIISDKHPFVTENFGDNALYFDHTADAQTIYKQIKTHYDWILSNPDKAKQMSDNLYDLFLKKFTLDRDLIRIAKMHEYVLKQERAMNLSYDLAY